MENDRDAIILNELKSMRAKLDEIIERLRWAPQSNAEWYARQHEDKASETELYAARTKDNR